MLRGELTNLRAVERSDARLLHRWLNDPELMRYWGYPASTPSSTAIDRQVEQWLDEEAKLDRPACFMVDLLDGETVGLAVLSKFEADHACAELSLLIGEREHWGKGIGTDVVETVLDACFDQWNLHRITVRVEAFNERARALYEKCGFAVDATLREASFFDGAYHDVVLFSALSTDRPES
jgi:RimJ/RimL family protein N-acetyltransferase